LLAAIAITARRSKIRTRDSRATEDGDRRGRGAVRQGQKGSSAMPHKPNPIVSEQIVGMARLLRGN
jgi:adenylosuccinate lyase